MMDEPEEVFKYTFKYENGTYYCWNGDCARYHSCSYLKDATFYESPDDLEFWAAKRSNLIVKVKVTYEEVETLNKE